MKKFFIKNFGSKRAIVHSSAAILAAGSFVFYICAIVIDAVPKTTALITPDNLAVVYGLPMLVFIIAWLLFFLTE